MVDYNSISISGSSGYIARNLISSGILNNYKLYKCSRSENIGHVKINSYLDIPSSDILIHLGEDSNISRFNMLDKDDVDNHINLFSKLLNKNKYKKILYFSSIKLSEYNNLSVNKYTNSEMTNYVYLKLKIEDLVLKKAGTVIRLPNIYGRELVNSTFLSDIYKQYINGDDISLRSPDACVRLLHIDDLILFIKKIINSKFDGIYDFSFGNYYQIKDLSDLFLDFLKFHNKSINKDVIKPKMTISNYNNFNINIEETFVAKGLNDLARNINE